MTISRYDSPRNRKYGQGDVRHGQQRGDLHQGHRRVEVHPAGDRPVDPRAVPLGVALGDLPLQGRAHAQLEQHLEEPEPPGEEVRVQSAWGRSPGGSAGSSRARRPPARASCSASQNVPLRSRPSTGGSFRAAGGVAPAAEVVVTESVPRASIRLSFTTRRPAPGPHHSRPPRATKRPIKPPTGLGKAAGSAEGRTTLAGDDEDG